MSADQRLGQPKQVESSFIEADRRHCVDTYAIGIVVLPMNLVPQDVLQFLLRNQSIPHAVHRKRQRPFSIAYKLADQGDRHSAQANRVVQSMEVLQQNAGIRLQTEAKFEGDIESGLAQYASLRKFTARIRVLHIARQAILLMIQPVLDAIALQRFAALLNWADALVAASKRIVGKYLAELVLCTGAIVTRPGADLV